MRSFSARIKIIGVNPYVHLPEKIFAAIFAQAKRSRGPIPVRGKINGKKFRQTLVKYAGAWRLYLNTQMRNDAGVDVGDTVKVNMEYDPEPRIVPMHPALTLALGKNRKARAAFEKLPPSQRKEILRYLHSLKSGESIRRTTRKIIRLFLDGAQFYRRVK